MDELDKKILLYLFRDGRISIRSLASLLNLTPPTVLYRIKNLEKEEILEGFQLLVNPNFYGKYYSFISFKNLMDMDDKWVFLKFKCVEWLNVYGIVGESTAEIEDRISFMRKTLGEPVMQYTPPQQPLPPKELDIKIVKALQEDPRASTADISKELGIDSKIVIKRLKIMKNRGYISVIPKINIPKSGMSVFSMFSKRIPEIRDILSHCRVLEIVDKYNVGIEVCLTENIENVRNYVRAVREKDKEADVMIIYDIITKGIVE
ncbi:winged helix-turn-helix transcriptional regulator [Acidianus infernus]|uniref:Winged helix-turn-helix transcriptional regulator n=1 Tax=Acidianus infernus TaxID=12915 RepID=A0A6A9QF01_ACIIN|nr:winged helix-turn-helix transcriptional regulator [Acidianus infernus]MUM63790.1 winged helix-turn-helix transcriptional regulator [Acidianus infernus]